METTFNSFLNEVRHKSVIHFFFFFPREIVSIALLFLVTVTVFASGPWWFHQVAYRPALHLPERNWLPSLALVSAAESLANGWNAAPKGGGPSLPQMCPAPLPSPSTGPTWMPAPTRRKSLKWWGWRRYPPSSQPEDCPRSIIQVPLGRQRQEASERQATEAKEAVIMLKTIMALLWEPLKQPPKEVINHQKKKKKGSAQYL